MKVKHWVCASLIGILALSACSENTSNKADNLFSQKKYEEAVAEYDNVLKNNPKYLKGLYNRGRAYEELGDYKKAENDFLAAYEVDPKNVQVMMSLSNIYQKQKNHASALLFADYAVQVYGAPALAFFLKGRALHQMGNTGEAMIEYSTAIKMDKDFGRAYYYRGMLKFSTDKKKFGCDDISTALKLGHKGAQVAQEKYCK